MSLWRHDGKTEIISQLFFLHTDEVKPTLSTSPGVVQLGKSLTLKCDSLWPDTYTFYKGDEQLQSGPDNTFSVSKFTASHVGRYRCLVECDDGTRSQTDWFTLRSAGYFFLVSSIYHTNYQTIK